MGKRESLIVVVVATIATLGLAYFLRKPERRKYVKDSAVGTAGKVKRKVKRASKRLPRLKHGEEQVA